MAKTKYFVKKQSKMADFLSIFVRNLKRLALTGFLFMNPKNFFGASCYIFTSITNLGELI